MSAKNKIKILQNEIIKSRAVLAKIEEYGDCFLASHPKIWQEQKTEDAIVLAEIMTNSFTCLKTIFLRISQHFENSLQKERWHQDLLHKMTLKIDDVRESVISDETHDVLVEFLKFRHFKRYYFEFNYDWDKLQFLFKKYEGLRSMIHKDLGHFVKFLEQLVA